MNFILNSAKEVTTDEHSLIRMKQIQTGGIELSVHLPRERHPSHNSAGISGHQGKSVVHLRFLISSA